MSDDSAEWVLIIATRHEGALALTRSHHALQAQEAEIEPGRMPALQAAQEAGKLPTASGQAVRSGAEGGGR